MSVFQKITSIIFIIMLSEALFGQGGLNTENNRAIRNYNKAVEYLNNFEGEKAELELFKAIKADSNFIEAYLLLGDFYHSKTDLEKELLIYRKLSQRTEVKYQNFYYIWGLAEWESGNYNSAKINLEKFLSMGSVKQSSRDLSLHILECCEFAISAIKNPVLFNPVNLGDSINTRFDEYFPSISANGQVLVITSRIPNNQSVEYSQRNSQEDFFISHLEKGEWRKIQNLGSPVNTHGNEGAQSLSADGLKMFFTSCGRIYGHGSCDIYYSQIIKNRWINPINLGAPVNTQYWESTPSISADGHSLFFSSNRPGGFGKMDIWKSSIKPDGSWTEPMNLGPQINTQGDELSPFIHSDGRTLYFSSDGLTGMGGFDLFMIHKDSLEQWDTAENLGYPINTHGDEQTIVINSVGKLAYFSSDRITEKGKDIYSFELPEKIRPRKITSWIAGESLKTGETVILENVFFKTDSFNLDPGSFTELDKLYFYLKEIPEINIQIRGHTDDTGDINYNLDLSLKRARSVYIYMINKGISKNRLSYDGFGLSIPRADNTTEEGRALNRRTEFKIIK